MQISYPSVLTKIRKLQNYKKKKKFFLYRSVRPIPAGIARNWPVRPVFFPVRNRGVERTGLLVGMVYSGRTGRYGTKSITLVYKAQIVGAMSLSPVKVTRLALIPFKMI